MRKIIGCVAVTMCVMGIAGEVAAAGQNASPDPVVLKLNAKDALTLSAQLLDEENFAQSLSISSSIYEQRKKDYVVAGILAMRAYFNTENAERAVFIGDDIKDAVQRDFVVGNESLSEWNAEMVSYFYWTFIKSYAGALYIEKRNSDAIPYFRKLIAHSKQTGGDTFLYIYSLASSCLRVGDFECAENSYLHLLIAAKKNVKYEGYENVIYYNLACAATGLAEYKKAKDYLLSTGWGWEKLEKMVVEDKDMKAFRDSEYYEQLRSTRAEVRGQSN